MEDLKKLLLGTEIFDKSQAEKNNTESGDDKPEICD